MSSASSGNAGVAPLLKGRRLVFFVGEGGVGKTSCAAALALAFAARGKSVAVLTIDPAPRLGDALGLETIDAEWRNVGHAAITRSGGRLAASRLDTKSVFDRLVTRFAPSPGAARRILDNPIYVSVSGQLSGADSYMAFQQLHDLLGSNDFDLFVVDTPPALHADEILGAPARLARLLETGAVAVVADPALAVARAGSKVAAYTIRLLLKALERVTGSTLRSDLADFAAGFHDVVASLSERATEVTEILRSSETLVVEVVRPDAYSIAATRSLRSSLEAAGLTVGFTLVNRLTPPGPSEAPLPAEGASPDLLAAEARIVAAMTSIRLEEMEAVENLKTMLATEGERRGRLLGLTASENGVESLDALLELGERILDGEAPTQRA